MFNVEIINNVPRIDRGLFSPGGNPPTVFHELSRKRDSADILFNADDDLRSVELGTFDGEMGRLYRTFACHYYPQLLTRAREVLEQAVGAVGTYACKFESIVVDLDRLRDDEANIRERLKTDAAANDQAAREVLNASTAFAQSAAFDTYTTANATYHATLREWNGCVQSAQDLLDDLDDAAKSTKDEIAALEEPDFNVYSGHAGQPQADDDDSHAVLYVNTDDLDAAGATISTIADSINDGIAGFNGIVGCDRRAGFDLETKFNVLEGLWSTALKALFRKIKKLGQSGCHIATEIEQAEKGNADRFIAPENDIPNGIWAGFSQATEDYFRSLAASPDEFIAESGRLASRVFSPIGPTLDVASTFKDIRDGEDIDIVIISSAAGATAPAIAAGVGAIAGARFGLVGGPGGTAMGATAGGVVGAAGGGAFSGAVNEPVEYLLERNRYGQWDDLHHKNYVKEQ
ncbi:hypothetical protein [Corynebacterium cystitidis]|uniref:hypothetical protein n=1 Tax=Corynebacterium cystitidis TaxID=35757 RepID=UPI00211EE9B7|nr:hypothetical protein [Corynebacterium cystitidis]